MLAGTYKVYLLVEKGFHLFAGLTCKIFFSLKDKLHMFLPLYMCNILYICAGLSVNAVDLQYWWLFKYFHLLKIGRDKQEKQQLLQKCFKKKNRWNKTCCLPSEYLSQLQILWTCDPNVVGVKAFPLSLHLLSERWSWMLPIMIFIWNKNNFHFI